MRKTWGHGQTGYAQRHRCKCQPCTVTLIRWAAKLDGIIDPITVERLMNRVPVWATHGEIVEAAGRLAARGRTHSQIAVTLRQTDRTVARLLAEHRATQLVAA